MQQQQQQQPSSGRIVPLCTGCDEARVPVRPYLVAFVGVGTFSIAHYCNGCAEVAAADADCCCVAVHPGLCAGTAKAVA